MILNSSRYKVSERVVTTIKTWSLFNLAVNNGNNHTEAQFRNGLRFSFIFGLLKVSPILNYLEGKRILLIKEIGKKTDKLITFAIAAVLALTGTVIQRLDVILTNERTLQG